MSCFNILDPKTSILGHHFLEASAGTGKTFAIEHLAARLIMEKGFLLDKILIVTFTRAAARELKIRTYETLRKKGVLISFDQAQIFTIHGFCHRMLTEYAYESGQGFGILSEEESDYRQILTEHISDFLRTSLHCDEYSTSQIMSLLKKYRQDKEALVQKIVHLAEKEGTYPSYPTFMTSYQKYLDAHFNVSLEHATVFNKVSDRLGVLKDPWKTQLELLSKSSLSPKEFDLLIAEKSVLALFTKENLSKKTVVEPTELYKFRDTLLPILEEATSPLCTLIRIAKACNQSTRKALQKQDMLSPDDILKKMSESLRNPLFLSKVRSRYSAAIIDEFQDTDKNQWNIFKTLFVDKPLPVFYLVGDPKQSIYSFRNADIYTYFEAQKIISQKSHLNTNYRSDPILIKQLNDLFMQKPNWLTFPFEPVKYSDGKDTNFPDDKDAVHFFSYETEKKREKNWPSLEIEQTVFFPFITKEIQSLTQKGFVLSDFSILVKDRFQGARLKSYLDKHGVLNLSKSTESLQETPSFTLIRYLIEAYFDPTETSIKRFLAHPLQKYNHHDLQNEELIISTIQKFCNISDLYTALHTLYQPHDIETYSDFLKISEIVLQNQNNPIECLNSFSDQPRRTMSDSNAVTIMTIHMSKGLEFNIVFALGLINRYTGKEEFIRYQKEWIVFDSKDDKCQSALQSQEEEKMRQLYVALTRAKKRVYIPLLKDISKKPIPLGQSSPIELFDPKPKSITHLTPQILTPSFQVFPTLYPPTPLSHHFPKRYLHSYSSLAHTTSSQISVDTETDLPKGPETGILIHSLLEIILRNSATDIPTLLRKQLPAHIPYETVYNLIQLVFNTPLKPHSFTLKDIPEKNLHPEEEFLYPNNGDYVKGFIDLIFSYQGLYYIIDWKTNLLADYSMKGLQETMDHHDYVLQAKIYNTALSRYLPPSSIGGTYYIFIRGLPDGILFIQP